MHHRSIPEKMIAIRDSKDIRLWRSQQHHVATEIEILHYDDKEDITTILATITRGIRHQIRVHLASIGDVIIGDTLYGKKDGELHLRSIWFTLH
jgi:23S rRNA-/tRNA-specific pseudouridylate synthase